MPKIAIIGASCAGHNAALKLREIDPESEITLLTEEAYPFYDRRKLVEFLAGSVTEKELISAAQDLYAGKTIVFLPSKKASSLNTTKRIIYFKDKSNLGYDFLVIASGRRVVPPEIPGAKRNGVFTFCGLDDYKKFKERASIMKGTVCLVGQGEEALAIAQAISRAFKVEVKMASTRLEDAALSLPQEIEIIASPLQEIIGEGEVQAVKFKDGKAVGASSVVFLEGLKNNTDFLKNTEVELLDDAVLVDEDMRASIDNIFACGAVARRKGSAVCSVKSWDDIVLETLSLASGFLRQARVDTCQRS
jgi:NAD(P)H-nitrite reductase large subunit